ncbi:MAG: hypothetical protein ABEJ72_08605 [Candidatus Aenigmatarchaeota archaeon]
MGSEEEGLEAVETLGEVEARLRRVKTQRDKLLESNRKMVELMEEVGEVMDTMTIGLWPPGDIEMDELGLGDDPGEESIESQIEKFQELRETLVKVKNGAE